MAKQEPTGEVKEHERVGVSVREAEPLLHSVGASLRELAQTKIDPTAPIPERVGLRRVAFDVDGCLLTVLDRPDWPMIDILRAFRAMNWEIYVWSGGGIDYGLNWARKLGITEFVTAVIAKGSIRVDVCFDDQEVDLADANVRV